MAPWRAIRQSSSLKLKSAPWPRGVFSISTDSSTERCHAPLICFINKWFVFDENFHHIYCIFRLVQWGTMKSSTSANTFKWKLAPWSKRNSTIDAIHSVFPLTAKKSGVLLNLSFLLTLDLFLTRIFITSTLYFDWLHVTKWRAVCPFLSLKSTPAPCTKRYSTIDTVHWLWFSIARSSSGLQLIWKSSSLLLAPYLYRIWMISMEFF